MAASGDRKHGVAVRHAGQKRARAADDVDDDGASASSSSTGGAVYHMAFTWSLWDAAEKRPDPPSDAEFALRHVELVALLRKYGHFIVQLERGSGTGRLHYQGYLHLTKGAKRRPSTLGRELNDQFFGIQFSAASQAGIAALKQYSMKEDTRVSGPWKDTDVVARSAAELKSLGLDIQLRPWQQCIVDELSREVHGRHVNVLYDPSGGMGKSLFAKWLEATGRAATFGGFNKAADLAHLLVHDGGRRAYIFDLVRTKPGDVSISEVYSLIEGVKNGMFTSGKYVPQKVIRPSAHVWVFTNFLPPFEALSADRWIVWGYHASTQTITIAERSDVNQWRKESYIRAKLAEHKKKEALAEWDKEVALKIQIEKEEAAGALFLNEV